MIKKSFSLLSVLLFVQTLFAQIPVDYYSSTANTKGEQLKTALYGVIGAHRNIGYDGLWAAYEQTDRRADGKVWDMYSNTTNFSFGTDQDRGHHTYEGDKYNREHSFPQSWFGADSRIMKADLFHVYPTDAWINGKRGSLPFGETADPSYESDNGWSKVGPSSVDGYSGTVFEPNDQYKGDFARTYFYLATAYENSIATCSGPMVARNSYPAYKGWVIKMLLRWAEKDPVSQKEIDRNNAVYKIQGNRNPFIDFPGLEQYVWGDKVSVAFNPDHFDPDAGGGEVNPEPQPEEKEVATPVFSLTSGEVVAGTEITISCATVGASIYYTINGGALQCQFAPAKITVDQDMNIEAYAMLNDSKSNVAKASYTLAKVPVFGGDVYTKIYSADELTLGCKYLIVCEEEGTALSGIEGYNKDVRGSAKVKIESRTIQTKTSVEGAPYRLTLNRDNQGYTFYDEATDTYLSLKDNKNNLPSVSNSTAAETHWTIDFAGENVIIANVQYGERTIRYNPDSPRFSTYINKEMHVALYKEQGTDHPDSIKVAAPVFSLPAGPVRKGALLTISSTTPDADIYYRINGGEEQRQLSPVTLSIIEDMVVEAYAKVGEKQSEQVQRTYLVQQTVLKNGSFVKVNSAEDLTIGSRYLMVCEESEMALAMPGGRWKDYRECAPVTIVSDVIEGEVSVEGAPYALTLGGDSVGYTFYDAADNTYLAVNTDDNDLNSVESAGGEEALWKVAFDGGNTTIRNVKFDSRSIRYNSAVYRFSTYKKGQGAVALYKEYLKKVAAPQFSMPAGEIEKGTKVNLTCETEGAQIYYQINEAEWLQGTDTVEIQVVADMLIQAYAECDGETSDTVSVAYQVVSSPVDGEGVFVKVNGEDELESGYRYLVVCEAYETAMAEASGKDMDIRGVADVYPTDGVITTDVSLQGYPYALLLGGDALTGFTFYDATVDAYLAYCGKSNRLPHIADANSKEARWSVRFVEGNAEICSLFDKTRCIMYNSDQPRFVAYSSTSMQKPVALYKETVLSAIELPMEEDGLVDVYTLDGQLLRSRITKREATRSLPHGIYVIGGVKLIIR